MPEGHTLHRLARAHRRHYVGTPVAVSSPQGRFTAAAALVDGLVLQRAEALGKHLFHVYGPDLVVHVHLGLYGTFGEQPLPVQPPQGQVRMRLVGVTHWSDLRGPTACELVTDVEWTPCARSSVRIHCVATPTPDEPESGFAALAPRSPRC